MDFDEAAVAFIGARKVGRRYQWGRSNHPDFAQARCLLTVPGQAGREGYLVMLAHVYRDPRKYGFTLIFRRKPVLRLDVEPGKFHKNISTRGSVSGTHWQRWPIFDAEEDSRQLVHRQWLDEFLKEANIAPLPRYRPPPEGRQLWLPTF